MRGGFLVFREGVEELRFFYVLAHVVLADTSPLGRVLKTATKLLFGTV